MKKLMIFGCIIGVFIASIIGYVLAFFAGIIMGIGHVFIRTGHGIKAVSNTAIMTIKIINGSIGPTKQQKK